MVLRNINQDLTHQFWTRVSLELSIISVFPTKCILMGSGDFLGLECLRILEFYVDPHPLSHLAPTLRERKGESFPTHDEEGRRVGRYTSDSCRLHVHGVGGAETKGMPILVAKD